MPDDELENGTEGLVDLEAQLAIAIREGEAEAAVDIALALARSVRKLCGRDAALERYQHVLKLLDEQNNASGRVERLEAWLGVAQSLEAAGQLPMAVEVVAAMFDAFDTSSVESGAWYIAQAGAIRARAHRLGGDSPSGLAELMNARDLLERSHALDQAEALFDIDVMTGLLLCDLEDFEAATRRVADVEEHLLSEADPDEGGLVNLEIVAATALAGTGDVQAACERLENALKLYNGFSEELRHCLSGIHRIEANRLMSDARSSAAAEHHARAAISNGELTAYSELAFALAHQPDRLGEEIEACQAAIKHDPDTATQIALHLADLYAFEKDDMGAARACLASALDTSIADRVPLMQRLNQLQAPLTNRERRRWARQRRREQGIRRAESLSLRIGWGRRPS